MIMMRLKIESKDQELLLEWLGQKLEVSYSLLRVPSVEEKGESKSQEKQEKSCKRVLRRVLPGSEPMLKKYSEEKIKIIILINMILIFISLKLPFQKMDLLLVSLLLPQSFHS